MIYRTLAASVLAIGLLAPVGAMAANNNNCSLDQVNKLDYADCKIDSIQASANSAAPAAVVSVERNSIGDYIDETTVERNQRSSSR
jgi:hypothetical protein